MEQLWSKDVSCSEIVCPCPYIWGPEEDGLGDSRGGVGGGGSSASVIDAADAFSRSIAARSEFSFAVRTNLMRELPDVLTVREVAEVLRCSKAHICKILNGQVAGTPKLPAIGLGRRKLVRRTTLLQWLSDNELGANMTSSLEVDAGRRA